MARIPDEEIERLKKEVALERLVLGFGVELKRHGAELLGRCPFHEDKTPSLVVSPKTNLWHCLGACNVGGSTIDWVMRTQGVSFRHAVELLRADHPSLAAGDGHVVKKGTTAKLEAPVSASADDQEALRQVVDFYHATLKESPEALRYLESRGLQHPEMLERFQIGFANRTLGYRLPDRNRKEGAELRGRLQRLGIIRESGHEHFMGSVVFPVLSLDGGVTEIYGRKITAGLRPGTPLHTYLPGPHRGVWNEEALLASQEIILCESILDALTFWCAGFRHVTASYGVNGFTEDHKQAFTKHGVKNVWIAYDRDEAGDAAAGRLKEELGAMGIGSHRVLFPKGLDANEYALTGGSLAVLLNSAEWWTKSEAPAPVIPLAAEPAVTVSGDEITLQQEDRRYRVRGLAKNTTHEVLKVNLLVARQDEFHVDTLDLNQDRPRAAFIKRAAEELHVKEDVIRKDVGRLYLQLEQLRDEHVRQTLEAAQPSVKISDEEREEALAFLKDPHLLDRIGEDFARCGLVGEETNKLIGYLAAVSRHLDTPLAVVVQSSSAAGKSTLMDAVLAFVPEEERIQYSAMTGQSLYYMGEMDLKHKVLAIVEEEGASKAAYALKLLQSEGALSIASTGKDPSTGKLVTHPYRVEGPVMIFLTTTAIDLDEELLNRCLVLTVNEEREQTQAIHRMQREAQTLEGLLRKQERQAIRRRHQNAQRLLAPLFVANPFAHELAFPDGLPRMRRDHAKYLALIRSLALLHQHQRQVRESHGIRYVEVTREDIATADRLMRDLLRRALDELPPQTRRLLGLIAEFVKGKEDFRFSRRDVREATSWGHTQLKLHLHRLEELEYLIVHRGGRGQSYVYELNWSGSEGEKSGSGRGQVGGMSAPGRAVETRMNIGPNGVLPVESEKRTYPVA
jgi:DNA primase catalytic core